MLLPDDQAPSQGDCVDGRGGFMTSKLRRSIPAGLALVASGLLFASPALAEGSRNTSFTNIVPGFDSQDWHDNNSDAAGTTLYIAGCRQQSGNSFSALRWQLTYNNTFTPDENLGQKDLYCKTSATQNWGRVKSGDFRFGYIRAINATTNYYYTSPTVKISW